MLPSTSRSDTKVRRRTIASVTSEATSEIESILPDNLPDPFVFRVDVKGQEVLYVTATSNERAETFPFWKSLDNGRSWNPALDSEGRQLAVFAAGKQPAWFHPTRRDRWAPEIHKVGAHWLVVYTARDSSSSGGVLRQAAAIGTSPTGPFKDLGPVVPNPRVRDLAPEFQGNAADENPWVGVIDGTVRRLAAGRTQLVVKMDGNGARWAETDPSTGKSIQRSAPTPLIAYDFKIENGELVLLNAQGKVLATNQPQHDGLIEGQNFLNANGREYVIYSSGYYGNAAYTTWIAEMVDGKATGERMLFHPDRPPLKGRWNGPGHVSVVAETPGVFSVYFHAWKEGTDYEGGEGRKALRLTVAFITPDGQPTEPYVVEEGPR